MAVGSSYERGLAQRAGRQGFDPYTQVGWQDRKSDWNTNWMMWEVNREYAGDYGRQVSGRFTEGGNAYGGMLSGTQTGPNVRRAAPAGVNLNYNFGRPTATNPANEIRHLDSALNTAGGLFAGAGAAVSGAANYIGKLRGAQGAARALNRQGATAPPNPATNPPPTPMMQSTVRRGNRPQLVDFNRPSDLKKVSNWTDEQVNSGTGYGKAVFGQMRTMAQQQMVENSVRRGGQPAGRPTDQPLSATLPDMTPVYDVLNPVLGPNVPTKGPLPDPTPYGRKPKPKNVKDPTLTADENKLVANALKDHASRNPVIPPVIDTNDPGSGIVKGKQATSRNATRTARKPKKGTDNGS